MLVLSRKLGEKIVISDNITVTVVALEHGRVRLGFEAPGDVRIMREEIVGRDEHDRDLARKPAEWRQRTDAEVLVTR